MPKVLVVEDDESMAVALKDGLSSEGYEVTVARDGAAGLRLAGEIAPHLIILDVMLPKLSGLDVCRRLRAEGKKVPIIMLTARGQEIDKVVGLRQGADDYVTKPFSFMELLARVESVLRRSGDRSAGLDTFGFGDVVVDFRGATATKAGRPIALSPRELRLLDYLVRHRGEVVGREEILSAVWGYDSGSTSRTVDMHIAKLRRKIEERPRDPRFILTVHGAGYKFTG